MDYVTRELEKRPIYDRQGTKFLKLNVFEPGGSRNIDTLNTDDEIP